MQTPTLKPEKLRAFIDEFHDGKQKRLAEAYALSQSQVSGWLNTEKDRSDAPVYMDKIIDLTRQVAQLSSELADLKTGRVLQMKSCYAVVQFADRASPGVILCRGIPDLDAANTVVAGLLALKKADPTPEQKEL